MSPRGTRCRSGPSYGHPWLGIGPAVRLLRLGRRISSEVLASRANISPSAVVSLESGRQRQPRWNTVLSCLQALQTTPEQLLAALELLYALPEWEEAASSGRRALEAARKRLRRQAPKPGRRSFHRLPPLPPLLNSIRAASLRS